MTVPGVSPSGLSMGLVGHIDGTSAGSDLLAARVIDAAFVATAFPHSCGLRGPGLPRPHQWGHYEPSCVVRLAMGRRTARRSRQVQASADLRGPCHDVLPEQAMGRLKLRPPG